MVLTDASMAPPSGALPDELPSTLPRLSPATPPAALANTLCSPALKEKHAGPTCSPHYVTGTKKGRSAEKCLCHRGQRGSRGKNDTTTPTPGTTPAFQDCLKGEPGGRRKGRRTFLTAPFTCGGRPLRRGNRGSLEEPSVDAGRAPGEVVEDPPRFSALLHTGPQTKLTRSLKNRSKHRTDTLLSAPRPRLSPLFLREEERGEEDEVECAMSSAGTPPAHAGHSLLPRLSSGLPRRTMGPCWVGPSSTFVHSSAPTTGLSQTQDRLSIGLVQGQEVKGETFIPSFALEGHCLRI
ncbi:hypothetical protein Cadr_000017570 [Camelus dromedarius]|uniref:Uncharacterized protein n=1 Tax=Camelus dromedarius TaxID=9838 RepID=A0A5N4DFI0_CAMDR|nr:hypothetical protein Cadr_000017570 [Camelus dromedarius]